MFLAKYTTAGIVTWAKKIGSSTAIDIPYAMTIDDDENLIITGTFGAANMLIGETGDPGQTTLLTQNTRNLFISKFNTDGLILASSNIYHSTSANTTPNSIAYSNGNYYVVGDYQGTITLNTDVYTNIGAGGTNDIFLFATNKSLAFQWSGNATGNSNDRALRVKSDNLGNIYFTGIIQGTTTFGGTSLVASSTDFYIAKYNSSGTLQWVNKYGGAGIDVGNDIALFNNNYLYVTGYFKSNIYIRR
jgi:hypothetical protein